MQKSGQRLEGKTALVTGGAVRIGAAICRRFAQRGADVLVHYYRSRSAAEVLKEELRREGARVQLIRGRLDTEVGCAKIIEEAMRRGGRLDVLVNNAAIFSKETWAQISEQSLLANFRTNLFAPLLLIREFAQATRQGAVINVVDRRISGWDPACIPYLLTKKALADATRILALALAPRIRVNAVAPGPILPPPGKGPSYLRDKAGPVPLKVRLCPEDVAEAVVFLACARSVTGQILFVDGGQHLLSDSCFE